MTIDTQFAGMVFNTIYLASFILIFSGYLRKGLRSGTSFTSLWLIFVTGMVLFRTGIYLFPMSASEIRDFLINGRIAEQGEKSIIGGVLGVIGFLIAIAWLKERISVLQGIAVPLILALSLQNIGCLMAGCCHGTATDLLWGITYPGHLHAVHPVQLLLFIATMLVAAITYRSQSYFKSPVSPLFFGLSLFFLAKMLTEFLRDPVTDHSLGYVVFGLKAIQWIQLMVSFFLGLSCLFSEKYLREKHSGYDNAIPAWRYISLLLTILVIAWKIRPLFDYTAAIVLLCAMFISMILVAWEVFKTTTAPQYRVLTMVVLLFSVAFMGQTYIPAKGEKITYNQIGGSLQIGNFVKSVGVGTASTDCNGNPIIVPGNSEDVKYQNLGTGVYYSKVTNRSEFKSDYLGMNGFLGYSNGKSPTGRYDELLPYLAVQPFLGTRSRYIGVTVGATLGYFHFNVYDNKTTDIDIGERAGNPKKLFIHPSFSFFVGPYEYLYVKYAHSFNHISPIPALSDYLVLGSGIGKTDGRFIELGFGTSGYMGQFSIPVKPNTLLNFSGSYQNQTATINDRYFFALGLSKRFNYKTRKLVVE
ncbi:MAG: prolipoprotein diacylglyceryl transferase family protein [Chloroflexota bacterium]